MEIEEIKKKAYEKYPVWMDTWYDCYGNSEEIDLNEKARNAYIEAYKEISALPTIEGWVTRDENGQLWLYGQMPYRNETVWTTNNGRYFIRIDPTIFPDLRWEDEPKKVSVTIKAE